MYSTLNLFQLTLADSSIEPQRFRAAALRGTSVLLQQLRLSVRERGEIFPVADQPYGFQQGRVADPDGHHWLIGKQLDD